MLLGPRYNMIRPEFCNLPLRTINKDVTEIMITTGGSDPYNVIEKFLSILLQNKSFDNIRINVLVGSGFADYRDLINFKQSNDNIFYIQIRACLKYTPKLSLYISTYVVI
ncbi:UDP-2 [Desulfitobacterium sp. AusDCA]